MIYIKVNENGTLHTFDCTVSDSVKYETVKFDFPISWEGYTKTAVFRNADEKPSVILNSESDLCIGEDECYIPYEVIKSPEFTVSVFGVLGNSRITTAPATIRVIQSGYGEGAEPANPTPGEYEQIISLVNQTKEIADSVRLDADNGAFNGKDGYTPQLGVDYVTIDQNTEYVFDGGDADQSVPTVIAVDDEFSEYSSNAIANKTVMAKFESTANSISTNSANITEIQQAINVMWSKIYPVGSIYISTVSTSPSTLFGGTWERIKDTFLLAAGSTYAAGATGGEATHTLTVNEMPIHSHNMYFYSEGGNLADGNDYVGDRAVPLGQSVASRETYWHKMLQSKTGGSQSHNNMPPYLAVYVWKRTA